MSDFLSSVLALEDSSLASAGLAGAESGKAQAVKDGRRLGEMKAWEIGLELGFMKGACSSWMSGDGGGGDDGGEAARARTRKMCGAVVSAVDAFPGENVEGEDTELRLQVVRAKFRVVRARIKMQGVDLEKVLEGETGKEGGADEKGGGAQKITSEF